MRTIKRIRRLLAVFALFLPACPPAPAPQPPDPPFIDADAYPPPEPFIPPDAGKPPPLPPKPEAGPPASLMGQVCAKLAFVGCPEGLPTPKGESCEQVYNDLAQFPGVAHLDVACILAAPSTVDAMRTKCHVKCR
jgi:hypothetical protein